MKFSPTNRFLFLANGSSKSIRWRAFVKAVDDYYHPIEGYNGWIEITTKIKDIPNIKSVIEYELGQYRADILTIEGREINWWKNNVFDAYEDHIIEFKIEAMLGTHGVYTNDIAYMFSGFVDRNSIEINELEDSIIFKVITAEDVGSKIAGERLVTQYIDYDVKSDGSNISGVILQIPNCYVINTNVSGYQLKVGVHTIKYKYKFENNDHIRTLQLNNGMAVLLNADNAEYTLGNGEAPNLDTERVRVYVRKRSEMPAVEELVDKIIIHDVGLTLPLQFYKKISGRALLINIYRKIGIENIEFDNLTTNTFDGRKIITYLDSPNKSTSAVGRCYCLENDGTSLFIGVGNYVYKRNMQNENYEVLTTLDEDQFILKLMYNARNNHLWILSTNNWWDFKLRRVLLTNNTFSDVDLGNNVSPYSCELIDYNYWPPHYWKYCVMYATGWPQSSGALYEIDGNTMNKTTIATQSDTGYPIVKDFMFFRQGNLYFTVLGGAGQFSWFNYYIASLGQWVKGTIINVKFPFKSGVYNPDADRIYYHLLNYDNDSKIYTPTNNLMSVHWNTIWSQATVLTHQPYLNGYLYNSVDNKVYLIGTDSDGKTSFISITGTTPQYLDTEELDRLPDVRFTFWALFAGFPMTVLGGRIYGLDNSGRLFQFSNEISFYVENADFTGKRVDDALHETLKAFNLIHKISPVKKAYVYKRGDNDGNLISTGNNMSVSIRNASNVIIKTNKYMKADMVSINNGKTTVTYDGIRFGANVLSDKKIISLSNNLIPTKIMKDLAYYMYQFFKKGRDVYQVNLGNIPLLQFEPIDGAVLNFETSKIQKSVSGVIYSFESDKYGTINIEVIV